MKIKNILKLAGIPQDVVDFYKLHNRLDEEVKSIDDMEISNLVKVLRCLSNPIRLKLLILLKKPHCVCVLSKILNVDITLISHHLAKLKECGLVKVVPHARARVYERNNSAVADFIRKLTNLLK